MTISNVMQLGNPREGELWANKEQQLWQGQADGRRVEIGVERTPALGLTEVIVSVEPLPGMPVRVVFRSRVDGWLFFPLSLSDVKKVLRHHAILGA